MSYRLPLIALPLLLMSGLRLFGEDGLSERIESAFARAGDNATQLRQALQEAPEGQREGMRFLLAHMPDRDLRELSADFLLTNVRFAYQAWKEAPWGERVPAEIFLNDVLPYASINERRDNWREDFYDRFQPLVADADSPARAAVLLNQKIFGLLDVRFSRGRRKADQSPYETIETGKASCTGLSVLLVAACRAVGVPARFAGTPLWADRSGNHSWVEIWDGDWHYLGAAEPSGDDLDRTWFTGRAATAQRDHRLHAIYATSFRPTGLAFPIVWNRRVDYIHAVNVTDRYAKAETEASEPEAVGSAKPGPRFDVEASLHAVAQLKQYLDASPAGGPPLLEREFAAVALTREDAEVAERLLWEDHVRRIQRTRADEMKERRLTTGDLEMPFFYTVAGDKPESGRSLYISMHGGGGAPRRVNDRQWENQKRLYEVEEGVYLAPRAPTDTWNLWHQSHIDQLFGRLIENLIVFEEVDPNRVYLLGYSAGGDGVYQLAPRMADRLAAAAMMAGHPNEASPLGLRNLPFTIQVGANDSGYNRNEVARKWGDQLDALSAEDSSGYVHWTEIHEGKGHWMDRQDAAALPWMAKHTRDPFPKRIVWRQDDVTHARFYWLAVPAEERRAGTEVRAELKGQRFEIEVDDVDRLFLRANDRLLNLDEDVTVTSGGRELYRGRMRRSIGTLAKTLAERGDPASVFSAEVVVALKE